MSCSGVSGFVRVLFVASVAASMGCGHPRSLAAFEGRITMHTVSGGQAHDMKVSAKGDELRFDLAGADGTPTHAVYDASKNAMRVFLDGTKQYMGLDFSAPNAVPNTNPSTGTIDRAGAHKTVAGYDCEEWSVKDASGHKSEVCIAQGIAYFDPTRLRPGSAWGPETALAKEFREKKSFPLESIEYDADGKVLSRMEVTKIEATPLSEREFAIPPGYTKVERPMPR